MTKTLEAFIFGSAVIGLLFGMVIATSSKLEAFGTRPHMQRIEVQGP